MSSSAAAPNLCAPAAPAAPWRTERRGGWTGCSSSCPQRGRGCTLALYLRRSDGVQLAAIPLDADDSVTVDRRLTGSVRGQWMLAAIGSGGYTAYTRPGSYDAYATPAYGRRQ